MEKKKGFNVGAWAFVIGLILAMLIAIFSGTAPPAWAPIVLAILGLLVGVLNITDKEVMMFLVAAIGFMMSFNSLGEVAQILPFGQQAIAVFFKLMNVFIAPAAAFVAVKALFGLAKDA